MVEGSIGRRYAKAVMAIAREEGRVDAILAEIERFHETCQTGEGELAAALSNPVVTHSERASLLAAVLPRLGLSTTTVHFLQLLSEKDRMGSLPDVVREYRALADVEANRVRATVTTATPLDAAMTAEVKAALEQNTGKTVVLETRVDPNLLGGMVARVGSIVYDASFRTRLDRLQLSLSAPIRA